ncbi:helix-turn-helix domain-containing protein [Bacillus sp. AFS040349]|uniref:helix-turn-helix domain-containing protein n=1 Tax=Bacillus sp. AFS040349 TaxID=2033502 RepID=UPI000BFC5F58|nr:helix-turn-helix transcriptional regulator [Bacillus sp. AFS040349]PGT83238.1 transcriptional regulator [Bacillus sp. AFS040349]
MVEFEDVKKKFGRQVREYRMIRNLSQQELAELTSLHRTYISDIERGLRNITLETIVTIAKALNVDTSELL